MQVEPSRRLENVAKCESARSVHGHGLFVEELMRWTNLCMSVMGSQRQNVRQWAFDTKALTLSYPSQERWCKIFGVSKQYL
jgi:hypothetical protein